MSCKDLHSPWLDDAISLPLILVLQLLLMLNTIYHECTKRLQISCKLRTLYILLQCVGLYWITIDLLRFVINPLTSLSPNRILCYVMAYSPKMACIIYYLVYTYLIFFRLTKSFEGSYLALSKITRFIFITLIVIVPVGVGLVMIYMLLTNRAETMCIVLWQPYDFPHWSITYCYLLQNTTTNLLYYACLLTSFFMVNVAFTVMFGVKLNTVLSLNHENENIKLQYKSLIVKNTILSITGVVSTIACYGIYFFFINIGLFYIYLDLFINCLVIGLMMDHNQKYYKTCCKCCILLCVVTDNVKENVRRLTLQRPTPAEETKVVIPDNSPDVSNQQMEQQYEQAFEMIATQQHKQN